MMLWMEGRRYNLWSSGNRDGFCDVEIMVMEELCEMLVEVRRMSDMVMAIGLFYEDATVCKSE